MGSIGFHDLRQAFKFGELASGWSAGLFCGSHLPETARLPSKFPLLRSHMIGTEMLTGLVNQELLLPSEYLAAENRVLRAKAGMSVRTHPGWLFRQNRSGDLSPRFQQMSRLGVPILPGSGNSLHHVLRRLPAPAFSEKPEVFVIFQPLPDFLQAN